MWCCSLFIARQRLESSQSGRRQRNFVNDHEQQQPRKGFWQKCKKTTFLFFQVFFSFSSLVNLPPEQLLVPLSIAQSHHLRPWTIRRELGSWTIGGKVGRSQKCKTDDTSQPLMGPLITNIGPLRDGFLFLCNDTWHNGSVRTIKITLSRPEGICICGKTASEKSCAICWEYILGAKAGLEQNRPRTEQACTTIDGHNCTFFRVELFFVGEMAFISLQGWFVESFRNSEQFWKVALPQQWIQRGLWKVGPWEAELGDISEIGKSSVYCQQGGASLDLEAATCDPDISGSIGGQSHPQPTHTHPCTARLFWPRWLRKFDGKDDPWAKALLGAVNWSNRAMFLLLVRRCFINKTSGLLSEPAPIYIQSWKLFIRCILIWCIFIRYIQSCSSGAYLSGTAGANCPFV